MHQLVARDFGEWRKQARSLLAHHVVPTEVTWQDAGQQHLFGEELPPLPENYQFSVPQEFVSLAAVVACHRSPQRWDLLYQLLWRLLHGEKHLLKISTDPLTHALQRMQQSIRRDAHKMKAFVRFRLVQEEGREHYIAFHRPDHFVTHLVAPFFARRFSTMVWTIFTPDESAHWDLEKLTFGNGIDASEAPQEDALESLWLDYYRATFNPARIKIKMMKREMPVRYWDTLPEAAIIEELLADAPARVDAMIAHQEGMAVSAADFLPGQQDLPHLRQAASACEGCELHRAASRTVFGEGPPDAGLMLVGEQPGDEEDRSGRPFVGPAGQLLDEALAAAGIQRDRIYITNAVKHFRFLYQDSFRRHQSPSPYHVRACKPWLLAEIAAVKPKAILCLGNIAARALISPGFTMKNDGGRWFEGMPPLLGTYHPSSILRAQAGQADKQKQQLFNDIMLAHLYVGQKK